MKRILFLADINSAHTQKWVSGVAQSGFEVGVFSLSAPSHDWYSEKGIQLLSDQLNNDKNVFSKNDLAKIQYLKFRRAVKKAIETFKPDIVHAHYATSYGMLGALSGFHPYILSVWGSDIFDFPNRTVFHKKLLKWNLGKADLLLATSNVLRKETALYSDKNIEVIPFGIDMDTFYNSGEADDGYTTVGIIKSLEKYYGIDFLIRAFADIVEKYPHKKLKLLIVGDGSEEAKLKNLADTLQLSNVTFTGKIPQKEVPGMHNKIDIFVCPSLRESFGVSLLEASACEVPVIASEVDGLKEVMVNNKTGLFVKPGNAEDIFTAIGFFLERPEMMKQYGKEGRKFVHEKYDWKKTLIQIGDIYKRIGN